jgi:hypothetical protein
LKINRKTTPSKAEPIKTQLTKVIPKNIATIKTPLPPSLLSEFTN